MSDDEMKVLSEEDSDDSFNEAFEPEEEEDFFMDGMLDDDPTTELKDDFAVVSEDYVQRDAQEVVEALASLLSVEEDLASALLRSMKWDREKVQLTYFSDPGKCLRDNHLQYFGKDPPPPQPDDEEEGAMECPICDDDLPPEEMLALGCGHYFCGPCWSEYLENLVQKGKDAVFAVCPMYKCLSRVPDTFVRKILGGSSEAWERYQKFVLRSFIEDHATLRWCPATRCDLVLRGAAHLETVECTCGNLMCWKCGQESHAPATCHMVEQWLVKCAGESENAKWILANTKRCPKCQVRIQKDHGCNHMTCRSCSHEFCWVCNGPWAEHGNHTGGFYKCNKYDPKNSSGNGGKDESSSELKDQNRYLFYYQRFHNHDLSKKFADRQRRATERRMQELRERGGAEAGWMDVQFLQGATEQVFKCRNVLKYTYVVGYYLESGPEKVLFEYLQQELERTTEHLSELSERPPEKLNRTEVVNYTRVTDQFMNNLLEGIANGLTSDVATYQRQQQQQVAEASQQEA